MTSPATSSSSLCVKFNTECDQTIKILNTSQHKLFTHARGHMSPLADDKITCLPRVQFSGTQQASRKEQFSGSEPVDRWPPGAHTASHRVSLHLAGLRVFCYHFCDKLKVSPSTALLTYQQAVATIQLSTHGVSEGRPLQRILTFDTCSERA